jgi:cysteinyl-tRNA synthetase
MRIFNTMSRAKEEFTPLTPGQVRMYVCGVTVYDLSHIGHARSAMVFDVIRRYLIHKGFTVTFVKNYTDIEDKIIRRAQQEGVDWREITERYIAAYDADMDSVGVLRPDERPKATDHIPQMIAIIERLIGEGTAYVVDGDVYFEIGRFPAYGRLSGKNLDELLVGARVDVDERKRDPRDFALWKSAKPGEPSWESPWGPGRPGWHIECSAMAMQYLGESFDIHGGGEDLVFPHHECEIAQSEACTGRTFARYWMHNGFVNMAKEKMSKSLGNTLTIKDIVARHHRDAIRLFLLGTHYRNPVEWAEERVHESARALERFTRLFHDVQTAWVAFADTPALPATLAGFSAQFEAAMDDDFNTPQALSVLFDMTKALYEYRDRAGTDLDARAGFAAGTAELRRLAGALGLFQHGDEMPGGPPPEVERLVAERGQARAQRNWKRADELRNELAALGWIVEDKADGPRVMRKAR